MKRMAYLHNHTHYSNIRLIDAIIKPEQLIDYTYELGASGVAITEHECLSSHVKALKYYKDFLKEKNITPEDFKLILGDEIYLVDNVKEIRDNFDKEKHGFWHFILLAKDKIGYHQLKRISSTAWNQSFFQRKMERVPIEKEQLKIIIGNDKGHLISSSACFLAGQKVRTLNGEKNIEDITENDVILTKDGKWEKINFPTQRFYNGKGNILTFTKEPFPIKCTANHQFLVLNKKNNTLIWKEAQNLTTSDKCLEPILPVIYTNKDIIYPLYFKEIDDYRKNSIGKNYKKDIFRLNDSIKITNELMRLFGLWLADGHITITEKQKTIGFSFSSKEFELYYNSFVKKALEDLGLKPNEYSIAYRDKNNKVEISIHKVEVVLLFKNIFGINHAETKYIPDLINHISKDFDIELLFGYWLGDGYFRYREAVHSGEIVSASISQQLTKDFEQLALSLNLSGSITISEKRVDKNNVHHKKSYYLTFSNIYLGKNLNKKQHFSHELLKSISLHKKDMKILS